MATVRDKANAGCDHLRYMLSSWFESSLVCQDETGACADPASMVGQAQPETQEQVRSFVLEVLFCAWKMHALDPGVRGQRNRVGSNSGWARHGVSPTLPARGRVARKSNRSGDVFVSRRASLEGARQAHKQLGSRYLRVQTTPPDDIQFGRRSSSPGAPSSPPLPSPPPWPQAAPPPLMASARPPQRSHRHARTHRSNKKRSNICNNAGKKTTNHPHSSSSAGWCRNVSPEPLRRVNYSQPRCQSAIANHQDMSGRDQDTAGREQDMASRKGFLGDGWGGGWDPHRPVSEKHQDMAGRKYILEVGRRGRGDSHRPVSESYYSERRQGMAGNRKEFLEVGRRGREASHRPASEWGRVEMCEKRTSFSVVLCGGEGLGSRRARRERPTKPVEVCRRVTACLERYSHLETRQRRAMKLCRAARLEKRTSTSRSKIVATATTKAANPTKLTEPGELGRAVVGCRLEGPALARGVNGNKGLCRGVNGNNSEGLCRGVNGTEGMSRSVNGNEGVGRVVNGNEGLSRGVNGNHKEGLGRGVSGSNEGLDRDVNGNIGISRYVNGSKGLCRGVNGNNNDGLSLDVNGNTGLRGGVNGNEGLGRGANGIKGQEVWGVNHNTKVGLGDTKGVGDGADVVNSVRSEMLGRGLSHGKESEREDKWI